MARFCWLAGLGAALLAGLGAQPTQVLPYLRRIAGTHTLAG